ncbi:uncharacterized protein LOC129892752 [Solanum dulcamara]|uniref:uncharacterized protein LOC129892752 n=1 Tax=Solanum dulcamara TaxID=45834 RepID=UPI002484D819|nr:uncharacterized protein LOC129892752 [Solanum dulcamara]
MAEYEACIIGIKIVVDKDIQELLVIGDSDLLIHQVQGEWAMNNSKTVREKKAIRRMANNFFPSGEKLYRRTPDLGLLRYVDAIEATKLLEQIHAGVCGTHMNGLILAKKILRVSYFWMTMEHDYSWGMDVIGPIEPAASNGHRFILVAIDYFTKWVEAASNSTAYRPQMNGAVEAANKNIKKIMRKMIDNHRGWHEMLPYALLGYRTTIRTSIGATPYLLVYGTEAIIPAEVEIPSLRIMQEAELSNADWVRNRIEHLALIDEKRMAIVYHGQLYQQRMFHAFNKRVRPRTFEVGQLVLKCIFPYQNEYKGKFAPNWQGPYMVRKVLSGGALILSEMDGQEWSKPINSDAVKRYYV